MFRRPITTTHDEQGYAHIILDMDEAQLILHALEVAVDIAPCSGGIRTNVAAASEAQLYHWAGLFARALGAINEGIAACCATPNKTPAAPTAPKGNAATA